MLQLSLYGGKSSSHSVPIRLEAYTEVQDRFFFHDNFIRFFVLGTGVFTIFDWEYC